MLRTALISTGRQEAFLGAQPARSSPALIFATPATFSPAGVRHNNGQLKILKGRLSSLKSVSKITKTMNMIAASKMHKARKLVEDARTYNSTAEQMLNSISPAPEPIDTDKPEESTDAYLAERTNEGKKLYIAITSDRGLCGPANSSINKQIRRMMQRDADAKNTRIICIGDKARSGLKAMDFSDNIALSVSEVTGNFGFSFEDVCNITDEVVKVMNEEEIDTCTIIYNKFINAAKADLTMRPLPSKMKYTADDSFPEIEFDLEREMVLSDHFEFTLANILNGALLNSQCWELASRMTAMDGATKNANEMRDRLEIEYNRKRQAAITTDITEITSGAAAIMNLSDD
jgi:ATP synthase F1 gamma subunit